LAPPAAYESKSSEIDEISQSLQTEEFAVGKS
jgi:hypothetical protein